MLEGDYYPLGRRTNVIGRDEALFIQVLDNMVSRKHLQIRFDQNANRYFAYDMKSRNGVYVNNRKIEDETPLKDGDVILIGFTSLLFADSGNSLCYRCHAAIGLSYVSSSHNVIDCEDCHTTHGSPYGSLLRQTPTNTCSQCHKPTKDLVFVGDGDSGHRASPTFYDIHAGTPLTCTSTCHDPHRSDFRFMIRDWPWYLDGLCLQCHGGVGIRF